MKVSRKLGTSAVYLLALAVAGAGGACSSSGGGSGTGGATGGGGKAGTGGATVGTGGHSGTGGSTAGTGGSTAGTGGSTAGTGGATVSDAGPGDAPQADGATGTGGASGDAATGTGGASSDAAVDGPPPIAGTALATFDADTDMFVMSSTVASGVDAAAFSTMTWDGTVGDPTAGSLEVTAAFGAYNESVTVQRNLPSTGYMDWTGKTKLHVRVRVDGGTGFNTDTHFPGGAQVFVQSVTPGVDGGNANYPYFAKYNNIAEGTAAWADYTLDLTATPPTGWDPTKVAIFGVQLNTGDGGGGPGTDGGAATNPAPATFHIDSFSVE